jgi:hypothetical protein
MWRQWLIEKLGGYATIDDAIDALRHTPVKDRHPILTLAVKKLFNTIGADDILQSAPGKQWLFEGRTLASGQIDQIMAEAQMLSKSLLWRVLEKDILYQVNKKMFLQADNEMHVITAKFWLYTFDTFRTRLKSLAEGSPLFNKK